MALKVLSKPQNIPTLGTVRNPVGSSSNFGVRPAVSQPVLSVAKPQVQPSLSVASSGLSTPIKQAQPNSLPEEKKVELAQVIQRLEQTGASYNDIQSVTAKYVADNSPTQPSSQQSTPQGEKVGFWKGLAREIVNPVLRAGATIGAGAEAALTDKSYGDLKEESLNVPFFGKIKPARDVLDAAGIGAEVAANFVGGGAALGVGKNIAKGAVGAALKRGASGGAKAGSLTGFGTSLQSEKRSVGKTVGDTALGGTLGGTLGVATGSLAVPVSTSKIVKNLISPSTEVALTKGIKPAKNNTGFGSALNRALPKIVEVEQKTGQKVSNLDTLIDTIKLAKTSVWGDVKTRLGQNKNVLINGNDVANSMISVIDKRTRLQNPALVKKIETAAKSYRGKKIAVEEAEDLLESANIELEGFYAKSGFKQRADVKNPDIGYVVKEAEALRDALNKKISGFQDLKNTYGALKNIEKEAIGRKNIAARQQQESLAEQIGFAQGAGKILKSAANMQFGDALEGAVQIGTAKFLKNRNTTDNMINIGLNKYRKSVSKPRTVFGRP